MCDRCFLWAKLTDVLFDMLEAYETEIDRQGSAIERLEAELAIALASVKSHVQYH